MRTWILLLSLACTAPAALAEGNEASDAAPEGAAEASAEGEAEAQPANAEDGAQGGDGGTEAGQGASSAAPTSPEKARRILDLIELPKAALEARQAGVPEEEVKAAVKQAGAGEGSTTAAEVRELLARKRDAAKKGGAGEQQGEGKPDDAGEQQGEGKPDDAGEQQGEGKPDDAGKQQGEPPAADKKSQGKGGAR